MEYQTATARKIRSRIENILDYAKTRGWRSGENPATWRGNLSHAFPRPAKMKVVEHHPAMPFSQIPDFFYDLREYPGMSARALEFTILNGMRTNEVLHAEWVEFDLDRGVWSVPANRMKARRVHRVPLSKASMKLLEKQKQSTSLIGSTYVFPGWKKDKPLSQMAMMMLLRRMGKNDITVHGFRSGIYDWSVENTSFPIVVIKAVLSHALGDSTETAYLRSDLFERRRELMEAWAKFCLRESAS